MLTSNHQCTDKLITFFNLTIFFKSFQFWWEKKWNAQEVKYKICQVIVTSLYVSIKQIPWEHVAMDFLDV